MTKRPQPLVSMAAAALLAVALAGQGTQPQPTKAATPGGQAGVQPERLAQILAGDDPTNLAELQAMQQHVQQLVAKVLPATVSLPGASGVLVRRDQETYVLCAAHVTMMADRRITITKNDGARLRGTALGANHRSDVSLVRVTSKGDHPAVTMGESAKLKRGQWVLMLGHPSGKKEGRSAPARLGRVLRAPKSGYLVTDCTMQAGDSGGPLFDMQGRVIGINSRINRNLAMNMHAPIDALVKEWPELLEGKVTQGRRRGRPQMTFGVDLTYGAGCPVFDDVPEDSPLAKAGLKSGDRLLEMDGTEIDTRNSIRRVLRDFRPGEFVTVVVARNGQGIELKLPLVTGE